MPFAGGSKWRYLFGGPIAAGEIVTLRGNGFGPEEPAFQQIGPDGKVTTTLAGVQVFFNQNPAPLLYVQSQQINAVVPWETRGGSLPGTNPVLVRVVYNGVSTNTVQVGDASAAPGLFLRDFTSPQAAAMNEDGTMNGASNPAKRGSAIAIFGTGGGPTNPPGVTGGLWPGDPLAQLTLPVSVRIAGVGADVSMPGPPRDKFPGCSKSTCGSRIRSSARQQRLWI